VCVITKVPACCIYSHQSHLINKKGNSLLYVIFKVPRIDDLTVVLKRIQVFWDMTPWQFNSGTHPEFFVGGGGGRHWGYI
jgi:hypothetical protein